MTSASRIPANLPNTPMAPNEPFTVPTALLDDPGGTFAYVCAACYGANVNPLAEKFRRADGKAVTRQAFWTWRQMGKGVPREHEETLIELIDDPDEPFRLASNIELADLLRHPARRGALSNSAHKPKENHHLLDLLSRITASPKHGQSVLNAIREYRGLRDVSSPYLFYRWGWVSGGVPPTYSQPFVSALTAYDVHELYDEFHNEPLEFSDFVRRYMLAPD
tara:strand:- start:7392 stop:8054 length:663 start_codon:yes stop_codon:yes gene_type:complete